MNKPSKSGKRKWSVKKTIAISFVSILLIAAVALYLNFNRLLANALVQSFDSNIISDVYELKFENLNVNPFEGSIRVYNVILQPREKPLQDYPYINSSFRLKAERLSLVDVEIFTLLRSNKLYLERISITKPDVELLFAGKRNVMIPFSDSIAAENKSNTTKKKSFESFKLDEFNLIEASFKVTNKGKQRGMTIKNLSISLADISVSQKRREYQTYFNSVALSVGEFDGNLKKGALKHISFKDFKLGIDSLEIKMAIDTVIYRFHDFNTGLHNLDIQTADSIYHATMGSFDLSYLAKSIKLSKLSFKPNVSHAVLQKDHEYQHTEFSGTVGSLALVNLDFDALVYSKKLFIDEILLDSVMASVFKDKTKSLDKNRLPNYLGQTISNISMPLRIKHIKATHVQLDNTERKVDSTYAKVSINRATLDVKNITNLASKTNLLLDVNADGYIANKAHFKASLSFHYEKPQFDFTCEVDKFSLPDLNPLIQAYTPAKILNGVSDELIFSGTAEQTKASGTMKFLYHDLEIDLELQNQAKWKNSVLTFAANTVLDSRNPSSANLPPRIVKFHIDRDMNKGFVNVIIKSVLSGLKETMIMSKENRKAYQKEIKEKRRADKKEMKESKKKS